MFKKYVGMCAMCLFVSPVSAQLNFDELLVFGDSLLDSGNLGQRFTNRVGDGNGDYTTGEYAQITPQLLAARLGISLEPAVGDGTNYAVGGYQTQDILNTISGSGMALPSGGSFVKPAYLSSSPSIGSNTLVLMDGGGNDLRRILTVSAPADYAQEIQLSASTLISAVGALAGAGAKYIMLANTPDLGLVPGIQAANIASPGAAAGFSAATAGYNQGVSLLAATLTNKANIIPVDLNGLTKLVADRAEDFGFTTGVFTIAPNVTFDSRFMCFNSNSDNNLATPADCIEHPVYGISGATPDPDRLFFNDSLHPTAKGGAIAADYIADIIAAPKKVGMLPEMVAGAGRAQVGVAGNELRLSRWAPALKGRLFVAGDISTAEFEASKSAGMNETDSTQLTLGLTHVATDNILLGVSVSASKQTADIDSAEFSANSYGLTGMLFYRNDRLFVEGSLGLALLNFDELDREVNIGNQQFIATGSTEGYALILDALVGYDVLESKTLHLAPVAGFKWSNSVVDAYQESGGQISNYAWAEQNRRSFQWRYGLVAGVQLTKTVQLYAEVFSSQEQKDDVQTVIIRNTNLDFAQYELPSFQADGDAFITGTLGAAFDIGESSLNVNVNYSDQGEGFQHLLVSYSLAL